MNIFTLNISNPPSESGTYTYNVRVYGYDQQWHTVYNGKIFVQAYQNTVNIELGDVLWNHKFDGEGYMSPVINSAGDNFVMCDTADDLTNYWYNSVQVTLTGLSGSMSKNVCFFNYNMFNSVCDTPNHDDVALFMNHQPTPHLPSNPPNGFKWRQLVYNGSFTKGIDGSTTTVQRSKLGTIQFTGGTEEYTINGQSVGKIDSCNKPYYLIWMTNAGGLQCQGFTKASEVQIDYENNTRVDMSNFEWQYNKSVRGRWKLKSQNLNDADYNAYGEMFNSEYLILLDMENGKLHYVNIKDDTYNRKRIGVNGDRSIWFTVDVESAELKVV